MVRSPRKTRSSKPSDKKPERALSVNSNPPADKKMDTAAIEACLTELLSGDKLFDKLASKLASKLETIVANAVTVSLNGVLNRVTELENQVAQLQKRVGELDINMKYRSDDLEQYQRRNNLRVFGIAEAAGEDTDKLVTALFREKLGIDVPESRLDRSHRVGKKPEPRPGEKPRPRPIIVRFTSYQDRRLVFTSKRKLKSSGYSIREDLTSTRLDLLRAAVERFGEGKAWTLDGKVMWLDQKGARGMATQFSEMPSK